MAVLHLHPVAPIALEHHNALDECAHPAGDEQPTPGVSARGEPLHGGRDQL